MQLTVKQVLETIQNVFRIFSVPVFIEYRSRV